MKDYWDLSEEERAELSEEQVQDLLKFELMQQGVLRPIVPDFEPVPEVTLHKRNYFFVRLGYKSWSKEDIPALFVNHEDAAVFANMNWVYKDYEYSEHCARAKEEVSISSEELPGYDDLVTHQERLGAARAAKDRNEKNQNAYEKELKAVSNASKNIWADWHRCRDVKGYYDRIRATFDEYLEMSDHVLGTALKFLVKVKDFEVNDVMKALPEYGEEIHKASAMPENNVPAEVKDDPDMSTNDVAF